MPATQRRTASQQESPAQGKAQPRRGGQISGKATAQNGLDRGTVLMYLSIFATTVFVSSGGFEKASSKLAVTLNNLVHVRSNTPDQPLVIRQENFFSEEEFRTLSDCLTNHPMIRGNPLASPGFGKTRGFMVRMNKEGLEQFRSEESLSCMVPYFDAVRLDAANAWVMNLLICDNVEYKPGDVAVNLHLDQSIAIDSVRIHIAHEVDVFYASIPEDMVGGNLEVWSYNHSELAIKGEDASALKEAVAPDEVINPVENTLVRFRGDSWHQVVGYKAPSGGKRISLVLEQYIKSDYDYPYTHKYNVTMKKDMAMM